MSSKSIKIAWLGVIYVAAHFVAACGPFCDCPAVDQPFFDYRSLSVETNDPKAAGYLSIDIQPDSVVFVAQKTTPRFDFISSAYGCKCPYTGSSGDKYTPVSMDVFADRAFNDTLPAGVSLRSLFRGRTNGDIMATLSADFRPEKFYNQEHTYSIATDIKPQYPGEPYHFRIQWVKSNGDTLVAQTGAVVF